jgi:HD-GYP domain-containing protein (c-di-GMP phosphodiesterase class II)
MEIAQDSTVPSFLRPTMWQTLIAGSTLFLAWRHDHASRQRAERLAAATLETLMNAIDANDAMTGQHVRRTAAYCLCLSEALDLPESEQRKLERVALFHDIGKIHAALFDIVHEDDRLSPEERARIATHAQRGAEVLQPLAAFYPELPAGVLAHHERWDGTGYPNALRGEQIPFYARAVAVADTFDAITHSRRYHQGEDLERAVAVIAEGRGTQFDPRLVDAFLSADVQTAVRHTYQESRERGAPRAGGPRRAERRTPKADPADTSAPDVQFRWRDPASVTSAATLVDGVNEGR